eukprot:8404472-Alexandrium_andersonii.AAC.4
MAARDVDCIGNALLLRVGAVGGAFCGAGRGAAMALNTPTTPNTARRWRILWRRAGRRNGAGRANNAKTMPDLCSRRRLRLICAATERQCRGLTEPLLRHSLPRRAACHAAALLTQSP